MFEQFRLTYLEQMLQNISFWHRPRIIKKLEFFPVQKSPSSPPPPGEGRQSGTQKEGEKIPLGKLIFPPWATVRVLRSSNGLRRLYRSRVRFVKFVVLWQLFRFS